MTTGELLSIDPQELQFPYPYLHRFHFFFSKILTNFFVLNLVELRKQISCSLNLSNKTNNYVAFKVKTKNPRKYCVKPNNGVGLPWSTCNVTVAMQAQKEAPLDMQCKDKFLLQSVVTITTTKDITPEMFNKESGHHVEECKLRVAYIAPPRPPSPVKEGSKEGSSPWASVSDNGSYNSADLASKRALISKLNEEKNATLLENNKLQQELELLRREAKRGYSGMKFLYIILVGIVGIILGYLLKRT
ncbi:hypothetical protein V6Z11_A12G112800 [Gossypium hirsutum]